MRTAYVDRLVADAGAGAFGRLVAPLGVEYIVLAKTSELADYVWIDDQPDLRKVLDTSSMSVYQVVPRGTGRVVDAWATTYEQLVASAAAGGVGSEAVLNGTGSDAPPVSDLSGGLTRLSPTRWRVEAGPAGWVVLPEEYSDGWQVGGRSGVPTLAGTVALEAGAESFDIDYAPWQYPGTCDPDVDGRSGGACGGWSGGTPAGAHRAVASCKDPGSGSWLMIDMPASAPGSRGPVGAAGAADA